MAWWHRVRAGLFFVLNSTNSLTHGTWLAIARGNSNKNMTMNTVNHCQWCLVRWQMRIFFYQPSSTTLWSGYRTCKFKFGWWQQCLVLWQETRTGLFFVLFQTSATGPVNQWLLHAWKASKKGFQSCIIASLLFILWPLHYLHFTSLTLDPMMVPSMLPPAATGCLTGKACNCSKENIHINIHAVSTTYSYSHTVCTKNSCRLHSILQWRRGRTDSELHL